MCRCGEPGCNSGCARFIPNRCPSTHTRPAIPGYSTVRCEQTAGHGDPAPGWPMRHRFAQVWWSDDHANPVPVRVGHTTTKPEGAL